MDKVAFENIVEKTFDRLPERFREVIENVGVTVEEYPDEEIVAKMHLRSRHDLLGLYQGIPLTRRGTNYGTWPTVPDKISLYQPNIERLCRDDEEIGEKIYEVLVHEIGHYFGMNEEEIRNAGF